MINNSVYKEQADLLIDILPFIFKEKDFALKGGTAINFFLRDMPRLSVDIDLTFLPVIDRENSIIKIEEFLNKLSENLIVSNSDIKTQLRKNKKLFISRRNVLVKIEPNFILRGSVYPPENTNLCNRARMIFEKDVQVQILSSADLYGGKICAALDRQHPRDIFDVKLLMDNEGISERTRKAFVIYVISHSRPINELLNPNFKDIKDIYENEFEGMTEIPVSLSELVETRENLLKVLLKDLKSNEKEFLISFKNKNPDWLLLEEYQENDSKLDIDKIQNLPAVKWKQLNLDNMSKKKHKESLNKLYDIFK